jgi:hypothetical protein
MTTTIEITETIQDGLLKAIETSQRLTIEAMSAGVSALEDAVPSRPSMPFPSALATPEETIATTFRFAESLLQAQKSFMTEVVAVMEPIASASTEK